MANHQRELFFGLIRIHVLVHAPLRKTILEVLGPWSDAERLVRAGPKSNFGTLAQLDTNGFASKRRALEVHP